MGKYSVERSSERKTGVIILFELAQVIVLVTTACFALKAMKRVSIDEFSLMLQPHNITNTSSSSSPSSSYYNNITNTTMTNVTQNDSYETVSKWSDYCTFINVCALQTISSYYNSTYGNGGASKTFDPKKTQWYICNATTMAHNNFVAKQQICDTQYDCYSEYLETVAIYTTITCNKRQTYVGYHSIPHFATSTSLYNAGSLYNTSNYLSAYTPVAKIINFLTTPTSSNEYHSFDVTDYVFMDLPPHRRDWKKTESKFPLYSFNGYYAFIVCVVFLAALIKLFLTLFVRETGLISIDKDTGLWEVIAMGFYLFIATFIISAAARTVLVQFSDGIIVNTQLNGGNNGVAGSPVGKTLTRTSFSSTQAINNSTNNNNTHVDPVTGVPYLPDLLLQDEMVFLRLETGFDTHMGSFLICAMIFIVSGYILLGFLLVAAISGGNDLEKIGKKALKPAGVIWKASCFKCENCNCEYRCIRELFTLLLFPLRLALSGCALACGTPLCVTYYGWYYSAMASIFLLFGTLFAFYVLIAIPIFTNFSFHISLFMFHFDFRDPLVFGLSVHSVISIGEWIVLITSERMFGSGHGFLSSIKDKISEIEMRAL